MNTAIAAQLAQVIMRTAQGESLPEAFEAVFGAGSYGKLAGMIYDDLRAQAAT